jgi:hypothetical protein
MTRVPCEAYADSEQDAIERAQSGARKSLLGRIAQGELPPVSANAVFGRMSHWPSAKTQVAA